MRHEVRGQLIKQLETYLDASTNVDGGGLPGSAQQIAVPDTPRERTVLRNVWPGTEVGSTQEEALRGIGQAFASIIRDEDYVVAASQQRAADDGSPEHVAFGRNEPALHHYHSTYRAAPGMDPLPLLAEDEVTSR